MFPKIVHVVGGGTFYHVRSHLALAAPAFGTTAKRIAELCKAHSDKMDVVLHLTRMADPTGSKIETNDDLTRLAFNLVENLSTKIVFWNPAVVDFEGQVGGIESGKYTRRLTTH